MSKTIDQALKVEPDFYKMIGFKINRKSRMVELSESLSFKSPIQQIAYLVSNGWVSSQDKTRLYDKLEYVYFGEPFKDLITHSHFQALVEGFKGLRVNPDNVEAARKHLVEGAAIEGSHQKKQVISNTIKSLQQFQCAPDIRNKFLLEMNGLIDRVGKDNYLLLTLDTNKAMTNRINDPSFKVENALVKYKTK